MSQTDDIVAIIQGRERDRHRETKDSKHSDSESELDLEASDSEDSDATFTDDDTLHSSQVGPFLTCRDCQCEFIPLPPFGIKCYMCKGDYCTKECFRRNFVHAVSMICYKCLMKEGLYKPNDYELCAECDTDIVDSKDVHTCAECINVHCSSACFRPSGKSNQPVEICEDCERKLKSS